MENITSKYKEIVELDNEINKIIKTVEDLLHIAKRLNVVKEELRDELQQDSIRQFDFVND